MNVIPVESDAQWHALRAKTVGASEMSALFGVQPDYALSHYALYQVKSGRIPAPEVTGNRPEAGRRFEEAIAHWVAEIEGWTIRKFPGYATHATVAGLGCTPDYEIIGHEKGPGLLEVKQVDWLQHRRAWGEEPPIHTALQLQAQLSVTGYAWGAVGAVVGGNEPKSYLFERRPKVIAEIERRTAEFWASIAEGREPPIDGSDSTAAAIKAMFPEATDEEPVDLSMDNTLPQLCADMLHAAETRKAAERIEQAAKSGILAKLGPHAKAKCNGFFVSAPAVPAIPDKIITPELVGTVIKGRISYRRITCKEIT